MSGGHNKVGFTRRRRCFFCRDRHPPGAYGTTSRPAQRPSSPLALGTTRFSAGAVLGYPQLSTYLFPLLLQAASIFLYNNFLMNRHSSNSLCGLNFSYNRSSGRGGTITGKNSTFFCFVFFFVCKKTFLHLTTPCFSTQTQSSKYIGEEKHHRLFSQLCVSPFFPFLCFLTLRREKIGLKTERL
jgi:hypothetical protein